jgi:hypothetical protein
MSLPKRSALIGAADLDAGQTPNRTAKDERMIIEILTLRIGCIPLFNERFPSMSQYAIEKKGFWYNFRIDGGLSLFQLLPTRQALLPVLLQRMSGDEKSPVPTSH